MKIGVFDSGVGGQSVANAIAEVLPEHQVIYRQDRANVPYGTKSPDVLLLLVAPIFQAMVADGCAVIVIACNTVSTTLAPQLRELCSVPIVAMEPMVKPAASISRSQVIAVCATPTTLASQRYQWLKQEYAADCTVLEPDCTDWAAMIEHNQLEMDTVKQQINEVLRQGADVVVLGCTHYHWIEAQIKQLCDGKATVLQPEHPVLRQLKRVLARLP